jgi:hypothetical protein
MDVKGRIPAERMAECPEQIIAFPNLKPISIIRRKGKLMTLPMISMTGIASNLTTLTDSQFHEFAASVFNVSDIIRIFLGLNNAELSILVHAVREDAFQRNLANELGL